MLNIIGLIVVGLIIGILARLVVPGRQRIGVLWTLLLGVGGALIGGLVASELGTGDLFELNVLGFVVAVIAATLLVALAERLQLGGPSRRRELRP